MSSQSVTQNKISPDDYLDALYNGLGYSFRYNKCTDQVEVKERFRPYKPLTDGLLNDIEVNMARRGFWQSAWVDKIIYATAHKDQYHPVIDFLNHLSGYDGKPYIDQVVSCFQNQDGLFPLFFRKWMIGTIAKALRGSQNPMLVIDGPQNIGKSLFVKWLCSPLPAYFCEGNIDLESKDSYIRLASKWIWEVGEVGGTLRKADYEVLKNFLTLGEVTIRKPYGRNDMVKPALASFVGTVNNVVGILNDPTGNRRFRICHVDSIDWPSYTQIDINMVWSEAYAAYLSGETWDLDTAQWKRSEENNEDYQIVDPILLKVEELFDIDPSSGWRMTHAEILNVMREKSGLRYSSEGQFSTAIGAALKKLGVEKQRIEVAKNKKVTFYFGIKDGSIP